MIDGSREFDELDSGIIKRLERKNVICCINKRDMKQKIDIKNIEAHFPTENIIAISALKGQGVALLEEKIRGMVLDDDQGLENRVIINTRQKEIVKKVKDLLNNATESMKSRLSEEFPCSDLRIAYEMLGEITGDTTRQDVLDRIFKRFCIGK